MKLWDADTGQLLRTFAGHSGEVTSVAFSPDGKQLFSGGSDGTRKLWDVATGNLLVTLLSSREGEWLAITPEGFFAASPKGTVMLHVIRGLEVFNIDQFYQVLSP